MSVWKGCSWRKTRPMAGFSQHDIERTGFVKFGNFFFWTGCATVRFSRSLGLASPTLSLMTNDRVNSIDMHMSVRTALILSSHYLQIIPLSHGQVERMQKKKFIGHESCHCYITVTLKVPLLHYRNTKGAIVTLP